MTKFNNDIPTIKGHIRDILSSCQDNIYCVFLAGSIIEGYGNDTSDVDVYCIVNEKIEEFNFNKMDGVGSSSSTSFIYDFIINGTRFDLEFVTLSQIQLLAQKITSFDNTSREKPPCVTGEEFELLHRLLNGKVIEHEQNYINLINQIDKKKFIALRVLALLQAYSGTQEDLDGASAAFDYDTVFFLLRSISSFISKAYLAVSGLTNPSEKWFLRMFHSFVNNKNENELFSDLTTILSFQYCPDKLSDQLKFTIKFVKVINQKVQNAYQVLCEP